MKTRDRLLNLTAIAVLGVLCLYTGWQWRSAETALLESQKNHDSDVTVLRSEHERLNAEVVTLQAGLDKAKGPPFLFCSKTEVIEMNAQGLDDPIADVMADLETRTDLVPFQPIGGGQTRIGTWLINCGGWALAVVEDGHKGILAILDYKIENGQFKWTVRAAEPDPATAVSD